MGDVNAAAHLQLLKWFVSRLRRRREEFDELVSVGYFGLVRAAAKNDPGRGAFSTYAAAWVRGFVQQWRRGERLFRHPTWQTRRVRRTTTVILFSEFGGDFVRGENPVFATVEAGQEAAAEAAEGRALLATLFRFLVPREREVIELRFGLKDGTPRTLDEVAKQYGITRERIRQIEARAVRKLRRGR